MKKLKLRALELGANEVFSREQLRNVLGGNLAVSSTSTQTCIKDGSACTFTGAKCCNQCMGSWVCGTVA
jgi:hypothetical protein